MGKATDKRTDATDGKPENNGEPIAGESGPIDPAAISGAGNTGDGDSGDDYARDGNGNVIRNRDGSPRRKRGRKPGSRKSNNSQKASGNLKDAIETLSNSLIIVHAGLATATKTPELALDKDEGDLLARSTVNVLEQFDIKPNPKVEAIVGLIVAAGTVYAPRMYLIKARKEQEAKEAPASDNAFGVAGIYNPDGAPNGTTDFNKKSN